VGRPVAALERFRDPIGHFTIADIVRSAPVLAEFLAWAEENARHPDGVKLGELLDVHCSALELADNVRERGCADGVARVVALYS
jgi:hypothetical protein